MENLNNGGGTWVAWLVEHPILDFDSGRDPRVVGSSPTLVSVLRSLLKILFLGAPGRLSQLSVLTLFQFRS